MTATWREMKAEDIDRVFAIAAVVHPSFPEDRAVFAERLALFPAGCRILAAADGRAAGYAFTHPWIFGVPPKLDTLLGALPAAPTTYYLHDIALLPEARGAGAASALLIDLLGLAASLSLSNLSLVAVNDSVPIWRRRGFVERPDAVPESRLASYGADAAFMARDL